MLARTPAAIKKRRARERARNGLSVFGIEMHEHNLIEALLKAEVLTETQALDRGEICRAAAVVLREWVRKWLKG